MDRKSWIISIFVFLSIGITGVLFSCNAAKDRPEEATEMSNEEIKTAEAPVVGNNPVSVTTQLTGSALDRVNATGLHYNADPYMIKHQNKYYCYTTGWYGVSVLRSDDLVNFEHMGFALEDPTQINYWAPSVIYYQGVFYMYYSSTPEGDGDAFSHRLKVATADNPLGPFTFRKQLYDDWTIDAHVVEKDGGLHLFFASKGTGPNGNFGTMCFYQKLGDPLNVSGSRRLVVYPTIAQELFDGGPDYCLEGPFYFEYGEIGYLMYSGNRWEDPSYFVGYATCDAKIPLEEAVFTKYPDAATYRPVIGSDEKFTGMGHNSVIEGSNGELFIVYHGYPRVTTDLPGSKKARRMCISQIFINGKEITAVPNK
ncbi:MAG: glycoside hydrolase family 43 protein [Treponema sp.]|jgi:beta-xylosidase|nr:glycoside hydrolase family 43 protein [Treponema sp.]